MCTAKQMALTKILIWQTVIIHYIPKLKKYTTKQMSIIIIIIVVIIIMIIIIIIIIIIINCNWVTTRWQWWFYMYTNMVGKKSN